MSPVRLFVVALVAALTGGASIGFAATAGVASTPLGGGAAVVGRCHTGAVSLQGVTEASSVVAIQVTDLDPTCDGGLLHLVVLDGTGGTSATGSTVVPNSRPVEIALDGAPHRNQVATAQLVVEGP